MHRPTILLPEDLREKARKVADKRGISLSELIREQLGAAVESRGEEDRASDSLFGPALLISDSDSSDVAARHDEYLYGPTRASST